MADYNEEWFFAQGAKDCIHSNGSGITKTINQCNLEGLVIPDMAALRKIHHWYFSGFLTALFGFQIVEDASPQAVFNALKSHISTNGVLPLNFPKGEACALINGNLTACNAYFVHKVGFLLTFEDITPKRVNVKIVDIIDKDPSGTWGLPLGENDGKAT
jgi:hypothetical protein